jgi:phosphohistidine phosphatase
MKTLFLMRHAKSSWDDPALADFDRPLNERGQKAAPLMGRLLRERKVKPDLVLSSPAERAKQTAALVMEAAGIKKKVTYERRIYDASLGQLLDVITGIDDKCSVVLIIGHNPGLEKLLEYLTGESERMPTAALARIALNIDKWSTTGDLSGTLEWIMRPKELASSLRGKNKK